MTKRGPAVLPGGTGRHQPHTHPRRTKPSLPRRSSAWGERAARPPVHEGGRGRPRSFVGSFLCRLATGAADGRRPQGRGALAAPVHSRSRRSGVQKAGGATVGRTCTFATRCRRPSSLTMSSCIAVRVGRRPAGRNKDGRLAAALRPSTKYHPTP